MEEAACLDLRERRREWTTVGIYWEVWVVYREK